MEAIELAEKELFDGKFSMRMPIDFVEMSKERARQRYPLFANLDLLLSNQDESADYKFKLVPQVLPENQYLFVLESVESEMKRYHQGIVFGENIMDHTKDGRILVFTDFISHAMDTDVYNFMFFTPLKGGVLQGYFSCRIKDKEQWKKIMLKNALSIHY